MEAAAELEKKVSVEVMDPRSLVSLDEKAIPDSVKKNPSVHHRS